MALSLRSAGVLEYSITPDLKYRHSPITVTWLLLPARRVGPTARREDQDFNIGLKQGQGLQTAYFVASAFARLYAVAGQPEAIPQVIVSGFENYVAQQ